MVTIYTKENCPNCEKVKNYLKNNKVVYTEKSIYEYLEEIELKSDNKVLAAPVVEYKENKNKTVFIFGYIPSELRKIVELYGDDNDVWDY